MSFDNRLRQTNLDRFLDCTTPIVPSQSLQKSETRNLNRLWYPWEKKDDVEFFRLSDVWNCFDELSAYGAGVPISTFSGETLVQYYVPYLSAIQIFTANSTLINSREETESGESERRDSSSDTFSDECESDERWRSDGCSSEEAFDSDRLIQFDDRLGHLYFQYVETSPPYSRVPLMDKITELARRFPGLMSLRSVDLSPASWMSVAWYPIYHIPMGRTIKDLSTCFLTYHTLSSSFQDTNFEDDVKDMEGKRDKGEDIRIVPFGLATYKMQGSIWASGDCGRDQERLMCLTGAAESWLKQLGVQHHDFNYFMGIRHG